MSVWTMKKMSTCSLAMNRQDHGGDHVSHDCRTRRRKLSTRQDPKQRRPKMVTPRRLSRTLSTRQRCSLIASRRTTITNRNKILHDNDATISANHLNERVHNHFTQTKRPPSRIQQSLELEYAQLSWHLASLSSATCSCGAASKPKLLAWGLQRTDVARGSWRIAP